MRHPEPAAGALRAKVILAANLYQQDELRGVKEVIRSFRALTKAAAEFPVQRASNPSLFLIVTRNYADTKSNHTVAFPPATR